jgi:hypothetical protein
MVGEFQIERLAAPRGKPELPRRAPARHLPPPAAAKAPPAGRPPVAKAPPVAAPAPRAAAAVPQTIDPFPMDEDGAIADF